MRRKHSVLPFRLFVSVVRRPLYFFFRFILFFFPTAKKIIFVVNYKKEKKKRILIFYQNNWFQVCWKEKNTKITSTKTKSEIFLIDSQHNNINKWNDQRNLIFFMTKKKKKRKKMYIYYGSWLLLLSRSNILEEKTLNVESICKSVGKSCEDSTARNLGRKRFLPEVKDTFLFFENLDQAN